MLLSLQACIPTEVEQRKILLNSEHFYFVQVNVSMHNTLVFFLDMLYGLAIHAKYVNRIPYISRIIKFQHVKFRLLEK